MCYYTNYILGTGNFLFQNVSIQDSSHNTYHYLVMGCLRGAAPAAHLRYLGKRTHFSIRPLATLDKEDCMFAELQRAIPSPPDRNATVRPKYHQIPEV